ncbi:Chloroplast import component protein (Tic20) [compost metagenome]
MNEHLTPSSTGLDPKVAGLLCYLLSFVTGIIFLVIEKQSNFVKFHAMQSIVVFGTLTVVNLILAYIPIIGWIASFIITPLTFILWIVLMLMALQGKTFKLPIAGDIAEKQGQNF